MKKGQMVKCVETSSEYVYYLTVGKTYPIIAGRGEANQSENTKHIAPVLMGELFNIIADDGDIIACEFPSDAHGSWELVQE